MVKVRDDQPVRADGSVDIPGWLDHLKSEVALAHPDCIEAACEFAAELEREAESANRQWYEGASSFRTGLEMADILAELRMDEDTLVAAILYRAVREEQVSLATIGERFGDVIAQLIDGVQQMATISQIQPVGDGPALGQPQGQLEQLRKMIVTLVDDVRVALIKLAERTCAIRQVKTAPREKRLRVAREVAEIYAPLAHRLGVGYIKWELEDLSFRYLEEDSYKYIAKLLAEKRKDRDEYIARVLNLLQESIEAHGIQGAEMSGRAKHIYSIWRKMKRKRIDFSQVYDVRAVRVLVPEVRDCYAVLGVVHAMFRHIPNEFDDYIATPKENGYRSLHTAVIGPEGKVLEIQIRTFAMHDEAELGVCAHWLYKGTDSDKKSRAYEEKIAWLRQVLEWHEEVGDAGGLREELRNDVAPDRIYVFTPDGHVVDLPEMATPVDFAYRVHTEVGHRCRGAKINGRIVPLTYQLKTGEQVEILTANEGGPSRDWLNPALGYVLTSKARAKVQHWFKLQARDQNIDEGRALIEKEFKRLGLEGLDQEALAKAHNLQTAEDMYAALGAGDLRPGQVLSMAQHLFGETDDQEQLERLLARPSRQPAGGADDVTILGVGNLMTQMAKCCQPLPGDDIVGYITVGRGVTIHRQDCNNLQALRSEDPHRLVNVEWGHREEQLYPVDVRIKAWDRTGLLRDITSLLAHEKANVLSVNTLTDQKENLANIIITLEIAGLEKLGRLLGLLNQLPNVVDVHRLREKNVKR
ncbi:GTP diphosphokinase [Terasakiispira papahanaumokuakeensis]|uniref:GTP pyrophosphokinase n=1 Tax=Terasakiispira papahanaumokuakeensis TaxID=197479 RepID=A0A1E2V7C2_9GAMM|nr:GTP diphosphokinase [Terasakiispira papahanaumokuakeensis]ODC02874.1 GTP diphosphokinase [Terasakiispira papahanaumokuakeensis]